MSDDLGDVQGQKVIHPMEDGLASGVKHSLSFFLVALLLVAYFLSDRKLLFQFPPGHGQT